MAPPIGRRSKQNSPTPLPPSVPLPGIALGLFAAIAAGLAASRALRRKKLPRSLEGEKQSISAGNPAPILHLQLVQEREIENKEEDDNVNTSAVVVNAKGSIAIAQEHPKLAAGLKPVFEAFEEVSAQTRDVAIKTLQEDEGKKEEEKDCRDGKRKEEGSGREYEENDKETGETLENGKTWVEEGEVADFTLGFEASLIVDEASDAALQGKMGKEAADKYVEEAGRGNTEREVKIDVCRDIDHDIIDDDGVSSDSQPSPVLINGRVLDFLEELPDFKEDPDHSSGSYSLSDTVSESSLQEVTSAPVKPFVPIEGYMEASWPVANPDAFVGMSQLGDKKVFAGDELGCDHERKEGVPELEESLSQTDKTSVNSKHDCLISNEDLDTCVVGMEDKGPVVEEVKFEMVADVLGATIKENSLALEGKISLTGFGCDESVAGTTRINGKVLGNGPLLPEEVDNVEGSGEDKPVLQSTGEIFSSIGKGEEFTQSMTINGKLLLDESPVDFSISRVVIVDRTSSQAEQVMGDGTICDAHMEPDLLPSLESSDKKKCVSSEGELDDDDDEPLQQEACFGIDASGQRAVFEVIVKESAPDCTEQNLDVIDSTRAENEVVLGEEQSSSMVAQKEGSNGNTTSCAEGSIDSSIISSGSEAGISDGLAKEIVVEEITCEKEEETRGTTRSYDAKDLILQPKKLASLTGAAHVPGNSTEKDADSLVSKGVIHSQDLQQKGGFSSKVLQYLPLELGFVCLLIALISFMLSHLEASTPLQQS